MGDPSAPEELQRNDRPEARSVYFAVTVGYDHVREFDREPGVGVDIRIANIEARSPAAILWNRQQKLCAPPTRCAWSLYLDGSLTPRRPIRRVVDGWLGMHEAALFRHPTRDCAYDEIDACVKLHKITVEQASMARDALKQAQHPKGFGLWACGMLARRGASTLHGVFANVWWPLVKMCPRDQIWLPLVIREHKLQSKINTIDADVFKNRWFQYRGHAA